MDNTCLLIEPRDEDTDATFVMVNSVRDGTQDGNCNAQVGYNTNPGARTMHLGMNCFVSVLRSQNEHRLLTILRSVLTLFSMLAFRVFVLLPMSSCTQPAFITSSPGLTGTTTSQSTGQTLDWDWHQICTGKPDIIEKGMHTEKKHVEVYSW